MLEVTMLALLLGAVHYFGESFKLKEGPAYFRIFSFASGISIAYLFLDLLPHTYDATEHLKNWVSSVLLLGFAAMHMTEKYIYQHSNARRIVKALK